MPKKKIKHNQSKLAQASEGLVTEELIEENRKTSKRMDNLKLAKKNPWNKPQA